MSNLPEDTALNPTQAAAGCSVTAGLQRWKAPDGGTTAGGRPPSRFTGGRRLPEQAAPSAPPVGNITGPDLDILRVLAAQLLRCGEGMHGVNVAELECIGLGGEVRHGPFRVCWRCGGRLPSELLADFRKANMTGPHIL